MEKKLNLSFRIKVKKLIILKKIKDTLKDFDDFTNKQQKCMEKYLYFESVFNALHIKINTNIKKSSFRQNKRYKNCPPYSFASSNSSQF